MSKLSEKIKSRVKKLKPRPKWQFVGYNLAKEIVLVALWFLTATGVGMVIYILSHHNPWEFLPLKTKTFWQGFVGLPWEMVIILAGLMVLIFLITRKIRFVYRNSPWVILALICISITVGYLVIEKIGLNKTIGSSEMAQEIYRRGGKLISSERGPILVGKIEDFKEPTRLWILKDGYNNSWKVIITSQTRFPLKSQFSKGDVVKVNGIKNDHIIEAYAIRELNKNLRGFQKTWKIKIFFGSQK